MSSSSTGKSVHDCMMMCLLRSVAFVDVGLRVMVRVRVSIRAHGKVRIRVRVRVRVRVSVSVSVRVRVRVDLILLSQIGLSLSRTPHESYRKLGIRLSATAHATKNDAKGVSVHSFHQKEKKGKKRDELSVHSFHQKQKKTEKKRNIYPFVPPETKDRSRKKAQPR
jgi:hypothetical protein